MKYIKFRIRNFKGIKDTELNLSSLTGANVFSLVGLNESGKTTVLEAIHSFAPDYRSGAITKVSGGSAKEKAEARVPRHLLASFTGEISVEATVKIDDGDRGAIVDELSNEYDIRIEPNAIPDVFQMSRVDIFKRGDYVKTERRLSFSPDIKTKGQRKPRQPAGREYDYVWSAIRESAPDIAYYPTLIFDFPERIYLTPRAGVSDSFYKSVFEDILAVDGQGYTLDDIVRRIRAEKFQEPWVNFFTNWMNGDDRNKVQQIIDRASAAVTRTVFGKWNKIFGEDIKGKELAIESNVEEGRKLSSDKQSYEATENHDIYVWFEIKDGTRRFKVNDRSLGFRWFFAFLLFTQFRVSRQSRRNVLFLFDEPAANLHAAAQQKLVESFPEIAGSENMLIYTTHSHYMIEPAWLEQTFIITNRSESPLGSIVDSATLDDESLDIRAHRYRTFVNEHPSDTSYFQPIVDRLQVVPSKFDYSLPSVVLEGKSDFYILAYAQKLIGVNGLRLLPAAGSGTFSALISIGAGWGTKFLFLLDDDHAGRKERERYGVESGARLEALVTLGDFLPSVSKIEDLLDQEALESIAKSIGIAGAPSKKQISQFFQESLARNSFLPLGSVFHDRVKSLLSSLEDRLKTL